jgi:LuxR family maltose regulon positive regulatory protein
MYFLGEILRNIDKTTLNFLLKTSLFDKFNTDLADYILSSEQKDRDSRRIIFRLMEMNFFLVNLDSGNEWFRYHHLFQAALQEELERVCSRDEISDIHRKAVEWFLGRNSFEDAFSHVLKYGNTDVVVEFVRNNMYKPLNENKWYVLEKWLKYIPEEYIRGCPVLLTGRMWVMQHKGLFQAISGILKDIEHLKEKKRRLYDEVKPEIAFFDGVINFWNNDLSASLDDFNYVRGTTVPDKLAVRSLSHIYYATASRMTGSGDAVFAEIQQMVSGENLHPAFSMILLGSLEYIKLLESDLYAAERIAERLGTLGNRTGNKFYIVWYEYFMAYIAFQQYRTDDAVGYFITSLKSVYLLNTHAPVDAFAGALLSLQISGRKKEYTEVYNKLISFIHEWNNPAHTSIAYSLMARLAVNENNLKEAEENIRKTDESFESANAVFNIEVPGITRCRVLLARNIPEKTEEALGRLETLKEMFSRTYNTPQLIEVSVLLAAGYKRSGETQKAVDSLNQALSLADKGYFIRPFVEIHHEIKELFPFLENSSGILSALKSHGDSPEKNSSLSNRELDVLFLLAERKSNKEIAEELYISPATVKKHSLAIYRKLGVKKRQEAVSAGREAGILQ